MNLLIAPDSFKGCLASKDVCAAIARGALKADKNIKIMQIPSSDGGEGFCDSMRSVFGGVVLKREVTYPLGNKGSASFVFETNSSTSYIELASAAGLALVPINKRNVMRSSTYGVGELIAEAVAVGAKKIVLGLGGSATNDCGIGMLSALGMRFLDANGNELQPFAGSLDAVAEVDKSNMLDLTGVDFVAACDVKNPLCGASGAAEVFARQKGASDAEVQHLDRSARSFASVLGIDTELPGAGAAGGVGAAMLSVLGAKYVSGASLLVSSFKFTDALDMAELVVTGEGNTDAQTVCGKLVSVVAKTARSANVPVIVISGGLSEGYEKLYDIGVTEFYALSENESEREYCITHASELLTETAAFAIRKWIAEQNDQ